MTLDPASVLNVLRQLRPHARVVSVDSVRGPGPTGGRPWRLLATHLAGFQVEPLGPRGHYLAHGHVPLGNVRPG